MGRPFGLAATGPAPAPVRLPADLTTQHRRARALRDWLLRIHAEYLAPSALYEVNLPSGMAAECRVKLHQLEDPDAWPLPSEEEVQRAAAAHLLTPPPPPPFLLSELFQSAASTIFALLDKDSFRRFLLTPQFDELLQQADEAELARLETQQTVADTTLAMLQESELLLQGPLKRAPSMEAIGRGGHPSPKAA